MSAKHLCFRWAVDLRSFTPSLTQLTSACLLVQPEEKTRLIKFHFIDDFLSSLVGRLLMRKFVSETTNIKHNDIIFDRDVRGKPYLKNSKPDSPQISFNVSHHGSMVVLAGVVVNVHQQTTDDDSQQQNTPSLTTATTTDFGVGIDVMKIEYTGGKTLSEFFRIMTRNFSASEWRYINRTHHTTEQAKLKAFIRNWCLKESFVKNIGVGISIDLQKISFAIQSDDLDTDNIVTSTKLSIDDVPATMWLFEEHMLDKEHCVAIAFRNCIPSEEGEFKFFNFDELLVGGVDKGAPAMEECKEYCRNVLKKERKQIRS
ncbi:L-aminoadipate-semialdehyde dehydrogenase-phosphopantetheinyl transferase [Episyrphus balteatus]|uniref:L-aminoadipate-semialdehyde dehydrogenase-phosphopantetheinyl transferase n=1 Tax=Episyrphus balteatus TaxID=286459 RepID=UPI0024853400|nr:L-aminoadipate-semialdehyde dehydrogenase-phosphopantetheinyl transferase [Episyrphus balteatus]